MVKIGHFKVGKLRVVYGTHTHLHVDNNLACLRAKLLPQLFLMESYIFESVLVMFIFICLSLTTLCHKHYEITTVVPQS